MNHDEHILDVKKLAATYSRYAGLAYSGNTFGIVFMAHTGALIFLDATQAAHVARTLTELKTPAPGVIDGNPLAPSMLNGNLPLDERDIALDRALYDYVQGIDQLARAQQAMDKHMAFGFAVTPWVNEALRAPTPALENLPDSGEDTRFLLGYYTPHTRGGALHKNYPPGTRYVFRVYGQFPIKFDLLWGPSLEPVAAKTAAILSFPVSAPARVTEKPGALQHAASQVTARQPQQANPAPFMGRTARMGGHGTPAPQLS